MRSILDIIKVSVCSVAIGNLLFLGGIIGTLLFEGKPNNLGQLTIGPLYVYFVSVLVGICVALFFATPIYLLFLKLKIANYITASIIGGCISLKVSPMDSFWLFLSLTGFIIGPTYHYFYKKWCGCNINITSA